MSMGRGYWLIKNNGETNRIGIWMHMQKIREEDTHL